VCFHRADCQCGTGVENVSKTSPIPLTRRPPFSSPGAATTDITKFRFTKADYRKAAVCGKEHGEDDAVVDQRGSAPLPLR
jgi:hypothetical protein